MIEVEFKAYSREIYTVLIDYTYYDSPAKTQGDPNDCCDDESELTMNIVNIYPELTHEDEIELFDSLASYGTLYEKADRAVMEDYRING